MTFLFLRYVSSLEGIINDYKLQKYNIVQPYFPSSLGQISLSFTLIHKHPTPAHTPPETNSSPLKNAGPWKFGASSFGHPPFFRGEVFVLGSVSLVLCRWCFGNARESCQRQVRSKVRLFSMVTYPLRIWEEFLKIITRMGPQFFLLCGCI